MRWLSHRGSRLRAHFRGFGGSALARMGPAHQGAEGAGPERSDPRAEDLPLRSPAMNARFRRVCAVFADGRCLIAEGYEPDDRLRLDLVALREAGTVPAVLTEESATLEEIAALWRAGGTGGAVEGGGAARRIKRLLADAAAARASDVVFEQGRDACKVFCSNRRGGRAGATASTRTVAAAQRSEDGATR